MNGKKLFLGSVIAVLCMSLVFGLCPFVPTVSAKTVFKTLAFDKKIESKEDFGKGEMRNLKIMEKDGQVEMSLLAGENGEYISPVAKAPFEALHIGLHWNEELANGSLIRAYVRTSSDGENFSQWVKAEAERYGGRDGIPQKETFASLIGTKKAAFAQAKIEFMAEKGISPKLKTLTLTFLNSGVEANQIETVEKTSPNGQTINVFTREGWGANEDYRFSTDGTTENWTRSYHGTRKLIIHHTADANSNGVIDLATNKETIRSIYYYHAVTLGWGDIGYNALVDAAGNIYEGRYGTYDSARRSIDPIPAQVMVLDIEAGHARSYNSGSFGVSALGDFTNFAVPDKQLLGIENVLTFAADSRGIDPQGKSDFLRYDGAWHYDLNNLIGHRDAGQTACPGNFLYSRLEEIKTYIDNTTLPNPTLSATTTSILAEDASGDNIGPGTITFNWLFSGASQYQYALEKVTGVPDEPWQTAWLNPENPNLVSTTSTNVLFTADALEDKSNYVFYVRALDKTGTPTSSVSHINFIKDENNIIVDNLADRYTNIIGSGWTPSTNVAGFYAQNYFAHARGTGSNVFEWLSTLFNSGYYDVYVWYTAAFDRAINAPYTIFYQDVDGSNLSRTITVNQKVNGGRWFFLDTFYFKAGNFAKIQLSDNARGYVIADAVKFTWNNQPSAVSAVFSDSFEVSEWNGLWTEDAQNDWFRSTQRAVDGIYSAEVDGSALDAKLTSISINLQDKTNATIAFSWFIEKGLDLGEYLAFDVSTDGGVSWIEKASLKGDIDPENVWHNVSVDLTGINNLQIQFRGKMSDATEDANVDMVKVVVR